MQSGVCGLLTSLLSGTGSYGQCRTTSSIRYDYPSLWCVSLDGTYSIDQNKVDANGDDDS